MVKKIRVTIWNEFVHEKNDAAVKKVYPDGIHNAIAQGLKKEMGFIIQTATLEQPEHGLTEKVLKNTDVLFWWGHMAHGQVDDEIVKRIHQKILDGMGLVVLHSGHFSKIFRRLMGTNCSLTWRVADEREIVWNIAPSHPIAQGIAGSFELPGSEMYGERFDIPEPDQLLFVSWYEGGNVFRSGCTFKRGNGKIFYFSPGHETYPIFYDKTILRILANSARWAYSPIRLSTNDVPNQKTPLAPITKRKPI
ncbi:MAG: trehalose utilization protein ThuA [Candidatus Raymondbacteria bacterium RifOxyA12_full_50_37]|uniref:Trehalose utilization protein ThuA n=1 Tax=Candidatus Raymondbacteria bacterium RIFOXYD12_FULL_49_13 TaxID=1817890 RepID=A0A1F7FCN9_UNCRA|nr:MAG: trehalose utilization protein ThuA [Candidatus Raymondbacteria bacterium RifOxyA12_full_50_37]OGJ86266.1 MAG: trehalose utilization protein ThuA [Candidatus Raymondbacteria bacterium RIFOXYA2_FULL_49_16]OGJ93630.1 MAG: trehalose utilization protein ThuA [Candidatus Raymondbacteria bacterium RifOxyC12_full_50_8]OGJ95803.1 MAG: trehalose utilization protein ThuA [Candidatus Raymondbacteria bacterium RIFOXYC2_FULL_50_21]OGJ95934.1 MAG: trehalose utilization protein ThuA [Candidatus Raymond